MPTILEILFPKNLATKQDVDQLSKKADQLMAQVQIAQESLDQFAADFSTALDAISEDLNRLLDELKNAGVDLPQANVDALNASLDQARGLDLPNPEPTQ